MNNTLTIDVEKCTACKACELVCSFTKEGVFVPTLSRIQVVRFMERGLNVPTVCQQCEDAPCMAVCPTGAMHIDFHLNLIAWEEGKCIFCRMCTLACPFGAVVYESPRRIIKCDLCGGEPVCVDNCIHKALRFEPLQRAAQRKRRTTAQSAVSKEHLK